MRRWVSKQVRKEGVEVMEVACGDQAGADPRDATAPQPWPASQACEHVSSPPAVLANSAPSGAFLMHKTPIYPHSPPSHLCFFSMDDHLEADRGFPAPGPPPIPVSPSRLPPECCLSRRRSRYLWGEGVRG